MERHEGAQDIACPNTGVWRSKNIFAQQKNEQAINNEQHLAAAVLFCRFTSCSRQICPDHIYARTHASRTPTDM